MLHNRCLTELLAFDGNTNNLLVWQKVGFSSSQNTLTYERRGPIRARNPVRKIARDQAWPEWRGQLAQICLIGTADCKPSEHSRRSSGDRTVPCGRPCLSSFNWALVMRLDRKSCSQRAKGTGRPSVVAASRSSSLQTRWCF